MAEQGVAGPDRSRGFESCGCDGLRRTGRYRRATSGWETAVWVGTILLLSYSLVGLGLAAAGWFTPIPVIGGSLAVAVAVFVWVRPRILSDPPPVRPHWLLTVAVLVLAAGSGIWNGAHHGEHLVAERDPGVYAATGLWLAHEGNLRVATPQGPFHDAPGVRQSAIGFSPNTSGSLDAQFVHLNAVFLAGAVWIGPTKMFMVPALLMAAALVLVYALGVRLGHPAGGAFGALALAVSFPFIYVARDTYSEPVALVLLLAGLWALTFVRRGGVRPGIVAGALLGATCLARIDGYIPLIPLAGVISMDAVVALRRGNRRRAWGFAAAWSAMAVCATAGALEAWEFSRSYFESNLANRLPSMVAAIVAATIVGGFVGRFGIRSRPQPESATSVVRWGFAAIALGVVGFLFWARYVRPNFAALRGAMTRQMTTLQLGPWADTISYFWLEWYLGPLLVAGGFAGLIWMTWVGLSQTDRGWLPAAGVGFATTLLYLYTPSITPDQPWATRRFVAVSIPLLLLAAGLGLAALARLRRPWSVALAGVLGAASLVAPARVTHHLESTSVGASLATRFDEICAIAHQQPSAILVTPARSLSYTIPETLGGWCQVPVAGATPDITAAQIHALARSWHRRGRQLLLVATGATGFAHVMGRDVRIFGPTLEAPEETVDRVPEHIVPDGRVAGYPDGNLPLFVIKVPGG